MEEVLTQGAEAKIIKIEDNIVKKIREVKPYRHPLIDKKLRNFRAKREFKVLQKLHEQGVNVPKTYEFYKENCSFTFEFLDGEVLKEVISLELLNKAFGQIIDLHKAGVVHGDLTTLNMMEVRGEIYILDFGLSKFSKDVEERAVDLDLFFTCLSNQHPALMSEKERLCEKYEEEIGCGVVKRLEKVEGRGRNKKK